MSSDEFRPTAPRRVLVLLLFLACLCLLGFGAPARAQGLEDDGGASWHVEKIYPPEIPGVEPSSIPVGLGHIGDIRFWAPNRGVLITAGNGSAVPPGVWAYNGRGWHELSTVCGASDGRIAWEGPDAFWTVSDGRPGQANGPNEEVPPLADNTLCHFVNGKVVASYATLAFSANSYQAMHAAACIAPGDCWFGGEQRPEQSGSFHLHWNGSSMTEQPYTLENYAVQDMAAYGGQLYESVQLAPPLVEEPAPLHIINGLGVSPTFEALARLPLYGAEEFPTAMRFLHLASGQGALWAAAGPAKEAPAGSREGQVTLARYDGERWRQLVGPTSEAAFPGDVVSAIAAEPGSESAWLALATGQDAIHPSPSAPALVARIGAGGAISTEDTQSLPLEGEIGAKGGAAKIACPAPHDCWVATTQGWLFHLSTGGEELQLDTDPSFARLITERPPDEGVPQLPPDAPPPDESGLPGEAPQTSVLAPVTNPVARISVALLSHVRSRLVHGSTLEVSFHLAVRTRLKLLARRRMRIVASTPTETMKAGSRRLLLRLDPRSWPTSLQLKTKALAPLPTISANSSSPETQTVGTSFVVLPHVPAFTPVALP